MVPPLLRRKLSSLRNHISKARNLSLEFSVLARPLEDIGVLVFVLRSHGGGEEGEWSGDRVDLLKRVEGRERMGVSRRDAREGQLERNDLWAAEIEPALL